MRVLAVDVGGTKVDAAVFRLADGRPPALDVETREIVKTPEAPPAEARREFQAWLRELGGRLRPDGWALAVAGPLSPDGQGLRTCPSVPFLTGERPLDWELGPLAELPFALANDLEAAGVGEARWGRYGIEQECVILDTLSTGWGGVFIIRGEVWPGEPGHNVYEVGGRVCSCGRRGCYETYFSGTATADTVRERFAGRGEPLADDDDPNRRLAAAAEASEPWALDLLQTQGAGIGLGWAEALNRLSGLRRILYMGGFAVNFMRFLEPAIRAAIRERSRFPRHWSAEGLPIQPATFVLKEPRNPTLIGAAAVWEERVQG